MSRDHLLDSVITDPAKLAITVSHHKTLQQEPGQNLQPSGIFAGRRKENCSTSPCLPLERVRNDSNSVSFQSLKIAKALPAQTWGLQTP